LKYFHQYLAHAWLHHNWDAVVACTNVLHPMEY